MTYKITLLNIIHGKCILNVTKYLFVLNKIHERKFDSMKVHDGCMPYCGVSFKTVIIGWIN